MVLRGMDLAEVEGNGDIPSSSNQPVLKVRDLKIPLEGKVLLEDIRFNAVKGERGFGVRRPDTQRIAQTLRGLGLYDVRQRHPHSLSGGQKQCCAVAVSRICAKDMLVFDEPTSGLDFDSMQQVTRLLRLLAGEGCLVFVVSHDFEFIATACSCVLHLERGVLKSDDRLDAPGFAAVKRRFMEALVPQEKREAPELRLIG